MKRFALWAGLTILTAGTAYAEDIYVPGTFVSYARDRDPITDENQSDLFVDEVNDTVNKTYVNFACVEGKFVFYLNAKDILLSKQQYENDETPDIVYRVDSQTPKTVGTLSTTKGDAPNLNALAVDDRDDLTLLSAFKNAKSKVMIRVQRIGMRELTFTFQVKGFAEGLRAVNNCK